MSRTNDQTEVQKLLDDGVLTKGQAKRYPRRNVLMSVLSPSKQYDLFEDKFAVQSGDRLLFTTGGFHELLPRRTIAALSSRSSDLDEFFTRLTNAIDHEKLIDDASCLAIQIT